MRKILLILTLSTLSTASFAVNMMGRTGIGYSNQLISDLDALSFKVQKSRDLAYGALLAIDGDDENIDYGLGVKIYKYIFDEPQLNFYGAALIGLIQRDDESGFQVDGTLGSEFHIPGIESVGFSFEFGISVNKLDSSTRVQTVGYNFFSAAVHFYL
ncbi:MAG: hypothetical protein H6621_04105 [Halobacteriovoraceae bacterium]|nr:hypothetical protein [Halobacteriovoraceae bacterium]MCB9094233.1 hypothetical protein [Halobacteriovoraceae bacterium]